MSKIVIIEDNAVIARVYESKFRSEGNQVAVAFDGETGIETVKRMRPDMVLVDLMLPNVSGIEVIKKLRRDPSLAHLSIVAYSGAGADVLAEAQAANPTAVLSKTEMSPKEIYENVRRVMEANRVWSRAYDPNFRDLDDAGNRRTVEEKPEQNRVLLAEDDPIIAAIAKNIIEKSGYTVVMVHDGREAYRVLKEDANFAAGVFDIEMPMINGLDLIKHMRTEKRLRQIPVMVMTAAESIRVQLDSHNAGAALFVPKPFERATFEQMFAVLVGKKDAVVR